MKNKLFIIIIFFVVIGGVIFYYQTSSGNVKEEKKDCCSVKETKTENCCEEKAEVKDDCCSKEEEVGESSTGSIYDLESEWTDQNGNKFNINNLTGKKVVMTMFYASCTYACPILLNDMNRFSSLLPEDKKDEFNYLLFSIDPERDTPSALKKLFTDRNLNENKWKFLTGTENEVVELAAALGFKFTKEEDGEYSHSNVIYIINEHGEIIYKHFGLNQPMNAAIAKVNY